jgi:hypothetical protein
MNNRQLQDAIDKARAFIATPVAGTMTAAARAKETTVNRLQELEHIQVVRAQMANTPRITLGDIQ